VLSITCRGFDFHQAPKVNNPFHDLSSLAQVKAISCSLYRQIFNVKLIGVRAIDLYLAGTGSLPFFERRKIHVVAGDGPFNLVNILSRQKDNRTMRIYPLDRLVKAMCCGIRKKTEHFVLNTHYVHLLLPWYRAFIEEAINVPALLSLDHNRAFDTYCIIGNV